MIVSEFMNKHKSKLKPIAYRVATGYSGVMVANAIAFSNIPTSAIVAMVIKAKLASVLGIGGLLGITSASFKTVAFIQSAAATSAGALSFPVLQSMGSVMLGSIASASLSAIGALYLAADVLFSVLNTVRDIHFLQGIVVPLAVVVLIFFLYKFIQSILKLRQQSSQLI